MLLTIKKINKDHLESQRWIQYQRDFTAQWVFSLFTILLKILFNVHVKHSGFMPSADVKPMSNNLVHALAWH